MNMKYLATSLIPKATMGKKIYAYFDMIMQFPG